MKQTNKQTNCVCRNSIFLVLRNFMYRLSVRCKQFMLCCSLISHSIIFKLSSVTFTRVV